MLARFGDEPAAKALLDGAGLDAAHGWDKFGPAQRVPPNQAPAAIADGMAAAHALYRAARGLGPKDPEATVLFVVQPGERNFVDQRCIEYELWARHKIPCARRTLAELGADAAGDGDAAAPLSVDGREVSVAYFRAGYAPTDYPSEAEWKGRERVERSPAVKCPTVALQLAGAKIVQQALTCEGAVERFLPDDAAAAAKARGCFAGQWAPGASDAATRAAVADALERPERYVLKPQREGGGNNVYGAEVAVTLARLAGDAEALGELVLMQRIQPAPTRNWLVRRGAAAEAPCVSELGVYSTLLVDAAAEERANDYAGWLLRVKADGVDEGGVATGFSVLSSPMLSGAP